MNLLVQTLGTPGAYAVLVYFSFHFLDGKVSEEAKLALSSVLKPKKFDHQAVGAAIVELFDRIYTSPLLSTRALLRSALFTILTSAIFLYETYPSDHRFLYVTLHNDTKSLINEMTGLAFAGCTNIASDFSSLFVVRMLLVSNTDRPLVALLTGPTVGIGIVALCNLIGNALLALLQLTTPILHDGLANDYLHYFAADFEGTFSDRYLVLLAASFVIHLWLPLFSLSVGVLRVLNYLKVVIGWTQWFLRGGQSHPLMAIGYVAATIVFIITIIAKSLL